METEVHASEALVRAYFQAINTDSFDDLANVFAPDAVLHFPMNEPVRGRESIRRFYENLLKFFPERYDDPRRFFFSENGGVAVEIHYESVTTSGRRVIFDAVDLFEIEGGLIKKLNIYYDSAKVLSLIGLRSDQ